MCGVDHSPRRKWCGQPVLPLVRAILSWNLEPPAGEPDWSPPWGNVEAVEDTSGNTYEELECLGLDKALLGGSLVASFEVKLSSGYSGPPCSAGSTEYVAFWADWEDDCSLSYLGTVKVKVHDYVKVHNYKDVGGGLCYSAVLPVDLGALRQGCEKPVLRRVRAVLSWNAPPSTTDPDAVPVWGNRIDRHVQIEPGVVYDSTARFTIVGGVAANDVDLTNGLTVPGAVLGTSVSPLPDDCPFAGLVVLHGPLDPALAGHQYRVRATNVDGGGTQLLTAPFTAVTSGAPPSSSPRTPSTGG